MQKHAVVEGMQWFEGKPISQRTLEQPEPTYCTTEAEVLLSFQKTSSVQRDAVLEGMKWFEDNPILPRDVEQPEQTY